ncbi:hypothetical protein C8R44DRAFT_769345 [Mycena epipterygia]|nr:hypothetical protein C8R44DRAFT_769345 [Mycena epipterygia]
MASLANFDIATFTGPMLLGHLFNYALLGALAIQVYVYTLAFPREKKVVKALVYLVFFLDLLQTGFATHYAWYVLAEGWGNPVALGFTPWTLATVAPLTALVAFLVQLFYSWRIWVISDGRKTFIPILAIIGITAAGSCVAGWYAGIALPTVGSGPLALNSRRSIAKTFNLDPAVTTWLAGAMACDIIITITLVLLLTVRRKEGLMDNTTRIVHRTIRMAVETGAITSIAVTTELALILNQTTTSWYFMLGLLITKLYSNSLLASLNARSPIFTGHGTEGTTTTVFQPSMSFALPPREHSVNDIELEIAFPTQPQAKTSLLSSTGSRSERQAV